MAFIKARARVRSLIIPICLLLVSSFIYFTVYTRGPSATVRIEEVQPIPLHSPNSTSSPDGTTESPAKKILLVTAFYPLSKSKHSAADYSTWLKRFLGQITTDVYFFTTPALEPIVRRAHEAASRAGAPTDSTASRPEIDGNYSAITGLRPSNFIINTTFPSPFSIPPLQGLRGRYEAMHSQDREQDQHSAELYAVWNAKPWFLDQGVINMNRLAEGNASLAAGTRNNTDAGPSQSYDYAFWTDAGSFRQEHPFKAWPGTRRVEEVWDEGFRLQKGRWLKRQEGRRPRWRSRADDRPSLNVMEVWKLEGREVNRKEDLMFFPVFELPGRDKRTWREYMGPLDVDFSEGSFFGSTPSTISWYMHIYYAYHDYYLSHNLFVGKDQTLINSLFLLFPQRFITVLAPARVGLLPRPRPGLGSLDYGYEDNAWDTLRDTWNLWTGWLLYKLHGKNTGICGDEWYYYQFWLADPEERRAMGMVWKGEKERNAGGLFSWSPWLWKSGDHASKNGDPQGGICEVTSVLPTEGILRNVFGRGWKAPTATLGGA